MFKAGRRERGERDRRRLMIAAAGSAGGEAFKLMLREIERELKALDNAECGARSAECGTPLNQADFERMLNED